MKKEKIMKAGVGILSVAMLLGSASVALAETSTSVKTNIKATTSLQERKVAEKAKVEAKAKLEQGKLVEKSNQAIDKRIADLNALSTRISEMKNVSDAERASLNSTISAQITDLNTLKTKIAANTDIAELRADVKSITTDNRIYMLVIPKLRIAAAADRAVTVINMLNAMTPKLQARIAEVQAAGKDVTKLNAAFADFTAKISDATLLTASVESGIQTLSPDQGNKTVMASNEAALKTARKNLSTIELDLNAARKDVKIIMAGVKGIGASASSDNNITSSTATTNASATTTVQ